MFEKGIVRLGTRVVSGSEDVLGYRAGSGQTNPAVVVGGQWGVCGPDGFVTSVVKGPAAPVVLRGAE